MQVHRDIENLPKFKRPVLTIGSFDGVHRGHRVLFSKIVQIAKEIKGESIIITFHPHPRSVIFPLDTSLRILTTLEEKIELMSELGIDHLVIVPFTIEFSHMAAEEYITQFLVAKFAPKKIVIGYDHHFGRNRSGSIRLLLDFGRRYKYEVEEIPAEVIDEIAISSTKIRNAVQEGNIKLVNTYLSYNYLLHGEVVHGMKIGNQIGFPTANIDVQNPMKLLPRNGIYAVKVGYEDNSYDGMMYIGTKSTVSDEEKIVLEVNIFDFNQSLYGEWISIQFISFIRGDEKFDSLDKLRAQLQVDKKQTERILHARH